MMIKEKTKKPNKRNGKEKERNLKWRVGELEEEEDRWDGNWIAPGERAPSLLHKNDISFFFSFYLGFDCFEKNYYYYFLGIVFFFFWFLWLKWLFLAFLDFSCLLLPPHEDLALDCFFVFVF